MPVRALLLLGLGASLGKHKRGELSPFVALCQAAVCSRRCSHSNLQALREIDARLLFSSPEVSLLGTSVESCGTGTAYAAPGSRSTGTASSCQATSGRYGAGQFRASTPLSCQMGFPVA